MNVNYMPLAERCCLRSIPVGSCYQYGDSGDLYMMAAFVQPVAVLGGHGATVVNLRTGLISTNEDPLKDVFPRPDAMVTRKQ